MLGVNLMAGSIAWDSFQTGKLLPFSRIFCIGKYIKFKNGSISKGLMSICTICTKPARSRDPVLGLVFCGRPCQVIHYDQINSHTKKRARSPSPAREEPFNFQGLPRDLWLSILLRGKGWDTLESFCQTSRDVQQWCRSTRVWQSLLRTNYNHTIPPQIPITYHRAYAAAYTFLDAVLARGNRDFLV